MLTGPLLFHLENISRKKKSADRMTIGLLFLIKECIYCNSLNGYRTFVKSFYAYMTLLNAK